MADKEKSSRQGHRQRVRTEILNNGIEHFSDRRVLEALLFYAYPYRDTSGIADKLVSKFGSLDTLLKKPPKVLIEAGLTENTAVLLNLVYSVARRDNLQEAYENKIDNCDLSKALCLDIMKFEQSEAFCIICINTNFGYLGYEKISEGTIGEVSINMRKMITVINQFNAANIILMHNHPSGNVSPSKSDINMTKKIVESLKLYDVNVLDHIIVGINEAYSFKENDLI
ncbi:MAG: RadC family protein [Lachnospirales bacterium]